MLDSSVTMPESALKIGGAVSRSTTKILWKLEGCRFSSFGGNSRNELLLIVWWWWWWLLNSYIWDGIVDFQVIIYTHENEVRWGWRVSPSGIRTRNTHGEFIGLESKGYSRWHQNGWCDSLWYCHVWSNGNHSISNMKLYISWNSSLQFLFSHSHNWRIQKLQKLLWSPFSLTFS